MPHHTVTRDNPVGKLQEMGKFKGALGILISKVHYDYAKKELNLSQAYLGREDFVHGISKTVFSGILSSGKTQCCKRNFFNKAPQQHYFSTKFCAMC